MTRHHKLGNLNTRNLLSTALEAKGPRLRWVSAGYILSRSLSWLIEGSLVTDSPRISYSPSSLSASLSVS
jgi:hypothetical protein